MPLSDSGARDRLCGLLPHEPPPYPGRDLSNLASALGTERLGPRATAQRSCPSRQPSPLTACHAEPCLPSTRFRFN